MYRVFFYHRKQKNKLRCDIRWDRKLRRNLSWQAACVTLCCVTCFLTITRATGRLASLRFDCRSTTPLRDSTGVRRTIFQRRPAYNNPVHGDYSIRLNGNGKSVMTTIVGFRCFVAANQNPTVFVPERHILNVY